MRGRVSMARTGVSTLASAMERMTFLDVAVLDDLLEPQEQEEAEEETVPDYPAPALVPLDGQGVLKLGLKLVGFAEDRQGSESINLRRFRAFFGIGPVAVAALYNDIKHDHRIQANRLLMALNFLKLYDLEHVLAGRWGINEKTLRELNRDTVKAIQDQKEKKVVWGDWEDEDIFIISVDGVHCRVQEVRKDPSAKWFDHKSHGAGVAYELGIAIRSGKLVWIKGPFPASTHDVTIFRGEDNPEQSLKQKIGNNQRAIGDSGYSGEPKKVSITRPSDSTEVKKFKARVKSRHETFNGRLKCFNVLDTAFRHDISQHKQCFEAVCIAVQYDLENGSPLFQI
jgi:hypothetical protein